MTNEKLVQSEDMCEDICEKMYEDVYADHVCPWCYSLLQHDYDVSTETGSIVCYYCGHTE